MSIVKLTGVVLAGGKSSRMGREKGLIEVQGVRMIERILQELDAVVPEVIISSNGDLYNDLNRKVYADIIPGCGPMSGIHSALVHSTTEKILVAGCDMPFINRAVFSQLIAKADEAEVVVPVHGRNEREPLCAIYSKFCLARLEDLLKNGKWKMKEALPHFQVLEIPFNDKEIYEKYFMNINTPRELEAIGPYQPAYGG